MNPTPTAANYPPLKFVIPGLIPVGLTILAGPPKGGKSWLALQIAVAADMGGEVLGICMPKLKVYYLALEDTEYLFICDGPVVFFDENGLKSYKGWEELERLKSR